MTKFTNTDLYDQSPSLTEYTQKRTTSPTFTIDDFLDDNEWNFVEYDISHKNMSNIQTIARDKNLKLIFDEFSDAIEHYTLTSHDLQSRALVGSLFRRDLYSYVIVNNVFIPMYIADVQQMNAYELTALCSVPAFKILMRITDMSNAKIWSQSGQTMCKNMILAGNWELIHIIEQQYSSQFKQVVCSDAMIAQLTEDLAICLNLSKLFPECSDFIRKTVAHITDYIEYLSQHWITYDLCSMPLCTFVNSKDYTPDDAIKAAKQMFIHYHEYIMRHNGKIYHRIARDKNDGTYAFERLQSLLVMTTDERLFITLTERQRGTYLITTAMWEFLITFIDFIPDTRHLLAKYVINSNNIFIKMSILNSKNIPLEELDKTCDIDTEMMISLLKYASKSYEHVTDISKITIGYDLRHSRFVISQSCKLTNILLDFINANAEKYKKLTTDFRFKVFVNTHKMIETMIQ